MTILDHPDAQALLADADLPAAAVAACVDRLTAFAQRYLPLFHRSEQRDHALTILRGKLTGLERKTTEPIARKAGQKRRPLQLFVGGGGWDDRAVLDELRHHVAQELADPEGVFILDPSAFPKKGTDSCGVARQWCGRLGKVENCQVGVFLAYAGRRGKALLDARLYLYLDQDWAADTSRRNKTYVPPEVVFTEKWRIGLELLDRARADLLGGWVVGDDEFGRCSALRAALR
jgi:SRSO17 transposase